jgi:hydrogenase maturation protein HypF
LLLVAILKEMKQGVSLPQISAKFHNTLVQGIVAVARRYQLQQVALTGGCFQNCYLLETATTLLQNANISPLTHHHIPPNDGSIAVGQILGVLRQFKITKDKSN